MITTLWKKNYVVNRLKSKHPAKLIWLDNWLFMLSNYLLIKLILEQIKYRVKQITKLNVK